MLAGQGVALVFDYCRRSAMPRVASTGVVTVET